jgi:hypothetical protein
MVESRSDVEAVRYLMGAMNVLKGNKGPFVILASVGLLFSVPQSPDTASSITFFPPLIVLLIVYPLICGQYSEIVTAGAPSSYLIIFNTHWLNWLLVSMIIGSPILLATFFNIFSAGKTYIIRIIISLLIDVLSVYVIPLVFLLKKRLASISLGIKCLVGNLHFSMPLILLTFFTSLLSRALPHFLHSWDSPVGTFFYHYFFFILGSFFDFVVFIAATIILRDKLLQHLHARP